MMKNSIYKLCSNNGVTLEDRLLCAVSGGMDSVAMLRVLVELGYLCGVAHCNFNLRGEESDNDEQFVAELANKFKLPFYVISFNTLEYAKERNISIQMAARDLRYNWFEKIRQQYDYKYVTVAHHSDDVIETVINNLVRGTGISGLTGIPVFNGNIFRPMLNIWHDEIIEYCASNNMKYRNDSSNSETKYARNLIRQKVIPLFEQINPAFKQTMSGNIKHFAETELLLSQKAEELVHRYVKKTKTRITIDLAEIPDEVFNQGLFFEMIRLLGFTASEAVEIIRLRDSQAGKMLNFNNLRILKDRDTIIFEASVENIVNEFSIEYGTRFISEPLVLHLEYQRKNLLRNIPNDKNVACIDIAALQFPLILRKWKRGDRLMPLGMKHEKKLSDFFCDIKLSAFDKENIWLLCSGNKIVWVVGQRIDERYKISEYTRDVLICKL